MLRLYSDKYANQDRESLATKYFLAAIGVNQGLHEDMPAF